MQYINHHCFINIDQMMISCKVAHRVNSCRVIVWYIFVFLSTDLILDELMYLKWSDSLQMLSLLQWYLTDYTILIYLHICDQYLFLIIYHEICYHRMTSAAKSVCTDYVKFIFCSSLNCCSSSVEIVENIESHLNLQSNMIFRVICQTLNLMSSSSFSITERKLRRTRLNCDWVYLICQFKFSIIKYTDQTDRSLWYWVRAVLSVDINNRTSVALSESSFWVSHHQSSVCISL